MIRREDPPIRISRKTFGFTLVAATTGAFGAGGLLGLSASRLSQAPEAAVEAQETTIEQRLNDILATSLNTDERVDKEGAYATWASSLEAVRMGLWVLSRPEQRARLTYKMATMRERGHPNLTRLTDKQLEWANLNGIHPETLAACIDAFEPAKEAVQKLKKVLRPDLPDTTPAEDLMINPGGMAMLVVTESGFRYDPYNPDALWRGFISIGQRPAILEINPEAFPGGIEALQKLAKYLSEDSGLNFDAANIQGSVRGNPNLNISGGAIGLQFMPGTALGLYERMASVGIKFNPFDLTSSLVGGWVFLAEQRVFADNSIRYGYKRGNPQAIRFAIEKWNPSERQVRTIVEAAYDYYNTVVEPQTAR